MKVPQLTITGLATAALVAGGMALAGLGLAVYPVDANAAPFSADEWCPPQGVPAAVDRAAHGAVPSSGPDEHWELSLCEAYAHHAGENGDETSTVDVVGAAPAGNPA
jgi:hypothetical protein